MGGLKSKIDEATLITYLEQMTDAEKTTSTIKVLYFIYYFYSLRER